MAINLNSYGNCTTDLRGTGTRSCDIQTFGDVLGIALLQKGISFNVLTDTLNNALWLGRLKAFQLFPFLGVYNFEQTTPDNEINTSSTGVLSKVRNGKPQFTFSFDKGGCFHKALYDKSGKSRWDIAMLFDKGLLMATNQSETQLKGFNMGLFDVETFRLVQGTDPQMSMAKIQLLDAEEFNQRFQFFTWEQLGFNALEVNGVVDTVVSVDTPVNDGDDEVVLSVANACNVDDVILGLDETANWALGGTQATPRTITGVAFDADTLKYTLTLSGVLAENDTIQPRLVSGSTSVAEDADGNLFKGQSALITVAAAPSV
jgi:hypothetical protein